MKKIFLTIMVLLFINVNGQELMKFSIYYNGNIPTTPYGCGFSVVGKKTGFFANLSFGDKTQGENYTSESNSGIYQIGSFGNVATGVTQKYINDNYTPVNVGFVFKAYEFKNSVILEPYVGTGLTFKTHTEKTFLQAEDVSTGYNVLGYYWVTGSNKETTSSNLNFCFGTYLKYKYLLIGMGYHFNPNNFQLSIGFNI
jgi:hypothetical protein